MAFKPNNMTLFILLLSSMMMLMGGAAVAPALPLISEAFPDASEMSISLIITLPSLAIAITGIAVGWLADRFGKARILGISLIIFTVAGASGFFLDTLLSILIGRFILGVGIAGISIAVTALITEYYTGAKRTKVIGFQSAAMGIGVLILETSGGLLANLGWREPFLIYMLGLVIFIGVILWIREPHHAHHDESEIRSDVPVNKTSMIVCYITIFFAMFLAFLLPTKLPYYMAEMGASTLASGLMLGLHGVVEAIFCLSCRRISTFMKRSTMLSLAFLFMGVGYCLMLITGSYVIVGLSVSLIGAGFGLITPTIIGWLATMATSGTSGRVMSGYSISLNFGQFASSILIVPILALAVTYEKMFMIVGIISLVTCFVYIISSWIFERTKRSSVSPS